MSITIGTDPEFFAVDANPQRLVELGLDPSLANSTIPSVFFGHEHVLPHGTLTNDGLALEFTVTPATSVNQMLTYLQQNIQATKEIVAAATDGVLSVTPNAWVSQVFIDMLPVDVGKKSSLQVLGCDPDYNVYSLSVPEKPDPKTYNWRTSGGHIHIGLGKKFVHDNAAVAFFTALLDQTIGAAGTILCHSSQARERLKLYGWAGMVRTNRDIGTVEYRTLPSQALVQTPDVSYMMFEAALRIGGWAKDIYDNSQADFIRCAGELVRGYNEATRAALCIINHNIPACEEILERARSFFGFSVLADLQNYALPNHFYLEGW